MSKIKVQGTEVTVLSITEEENFISLTDMARYKGIQNGQIISFKIGSETVILLNF